METKEQLIRVILEYKKKENEIQLLQKEIKNKKLEQKEISNELMEVMKEHQIEVFETKDSDIIYSKTKRKSGLNKKFIEQQLSLFLKDKNLGENACNFIYDNRIEKEVEKIVNKKRK
jgi:hypothetical protein